MDKIIETALRGLLLPPLIELVISYVYFEPKHSKCICGSKLLPHFEDDDDSLGCFPGAPDEHCFGYCDGETNPWWCKDCEKLYQQCPSCNSWLFLVGHHGIKADKRESSWSREKFGEPVYLHSWKGVEEGIESETDPYEDLEEPRYNISDFYLTFLDTKEWIPTGPDGGYVHIWNCFTCNKTFNLTDK
jgi:hypothetical protein